VRSHGRVSYLDQIASRTVAAPGALRPPSMFGFLSREAPLQARGTEDDKIDSEPPARQLTVATSSKLESPGPIRQMATQIESMQPSRRIEGPASLPKRRVPPPLVPEVTMPATSIKPSRDEAVAAATMRRSAGVRLRETTSVGAEPPEIPIAGPSTRISAKQGLTVPNAWLAGPPSSQGVGSAHRAADSAAALPPLRKQVTVNRPRAELGSLATVDVVSTKFRAASPSRSLHIGAIEVVLASDKTANAPPTPSSPPHVLRAPAPSPSARGSLSRGFASDFGLRQG